MGIIRITKEFNFEMAHALYKHDGACKFIHGHSYKLAVTVKGTPSANVESPNNGMVIDFKELKRIVNTEIINVYDHALVLNTNAPYDTLSSVELFDKLIKVPYQPTCENLVVDFAIKIKALLPKEVTLQKIRLHETATSFAEWLAEDN